MVAIAWARYEFMLCQEVRTSIADRFARYARANTKANFAAVARWLPVCENVQCLFQIALLSGRQLAVENDHVGLMQVNQRLQLLDFARADLRSRVHSGARLDLALGHLCAGRRRQRRELRQ